MMVLPSRSEARHELLPAQEPAAAAIGIGHVSQMTAGWTFQAVDMFVLLIASLGLILNGLLELLRSCLLRRFPEA